MPQYSIDGHLGQIHVSVIYENWYIDIDKYLFKLVGLFCFLDKIYDGVGVILYCIILYIVCFKESPYVGNPRFDFFQL